MKTVLAICYLSKETNILRRYGLMLAEGHEQSELLRAQMRILSRPVRELGDAVGSFCEFRQKQDFYMNTRNQICPAEYALDQKRHGLFTRFRRNGKLFAAFNAQYGEPEEKPDMVYVSYRGETWKDVKNHTASRFNISVACPQRPDSNVLCPVTFNLYPAAYQ